MPSKRTSICDGIIETLFTSQNIPHITFKSGRELTSPTCVQYPMCAEWIFMECPELHCFGHFGLFGGHPLPVDPWPLLQKWVMAAIPAFATPNTDFEKVDSKLLSRHRAACKLLFVCFLCGCPLQHAEQDKAWKLTSTCEMGFRLFVRFASDLHLLSRLNWHLISTHLLQKC